MLIVPITQRQARAFVREHHRHLPKPPRGDVIRVGLEIGGELVAVALAGRPNAPGLQDGRTLEITRVATTGHRNACSMLYGSLCRAAKALGWTRVITYTRANEHGASLRASGFEPVADTPARSWAEQSGRDRYETNLFGEEITDQEPRVRWERRLGKDTTVSNFDHVEEHREAVDRYFGSTPPDDDTYPIEQPDAELELDRDAIADRTFALLDADPRLRRIT